MQVAYPENLYRQEHRGDERIGRAGEHHHHPDRGGESRRYAEKRADHAAESRSDEERRNDFTALKSGFQSHHREQDLQQECGWDSFALFDRAPDDFDACAVIVSRTDDKRQNYDESTSDDDADE